MRVECDGKIIQLERISNVSKLLESLSLNRETYLVIVNNKLVTEDYKLSENDEIKIIKVVSGG